MSHKAAEPSATASAALPSRIAGTLEAHAAGIAVVVLTGLFAVCLFHDVRTPLWTDELLTLYVTQQPSIADVVGAIRDGADSQPPLYDFIVRSLRPIIANDALRVRLPSTIGFFLMCVCVLVFVQRRLPRIYALLAMLIVAYTSWPYATEGRAYGLVLGCVSVALLCWQSAREDRYSTPAMAIALIAAVSLHYYAVFAVGALFLGELVRWRSTKKLDLRVMAGLVLAPLILIPHLPLIRAGQPFLIHFWSKADVNTLSIYYLYTYNMLASTVAFAAVCWILLRVVALGKARTPQNPTRGMPPHEWLVALTLALLPAVVIGVALFTVKAFVNRYVQWSMIGVGIFFAFALYRATRGNVIVAAIVALPLLLWSVDIVTDTLSETPAPRFAGTLPRELARIPPGSTPIVIAGIHPFMELWYYSEPDLRNRLLHLVSPALELRYAKNDTASLVLLALRRRKSMGIDECEVFLADHTQFILAGNSDDWLVKHLRRLNYRFTPLTQEGGRFGLYEVRAPEAR